MAQKLTGFVATAGRKCLFIIGTNPVHSPMLLWKKYLEKLKNKNVEALLFTQANGNLSPNG
ncbi:MAG: hypothetical protein V7K50_15700 [Nostoc sp.]|uniref:hypothetical protein n=1 Tax=Nostoc sp. TaxID=1180 RepID=UPI002FFCC1B1